MTEFTPNQGDPYCPEFLKMPKYPKIPTPGTSYLPGVVLNEFSSCVRSNYLVWCRIRPQEAKFMFLGHIGSILIFRSNSGWVRSPKMVSRAIPSILLNLKMLFKAPLGVKNIQGWLQMVFWGATELAPRAGPRAGLRAGPRAGPRTPLLRYRR